MKSLLILENHQLLAETLKCLIQNRSDIRVAAIAETSEEALEILSTLEVDLVLVDFSPPGAKNLEFIKNVSQLYPNLPTLVLSYSLSLAYTRLALEAGACGCVTLDDSDSMIETINKTLQGEKFDSISFA